MSRLNRKVTGAFVMFMAINSCMAGAVVLGDPNAVVNGNVTISNALGSFTARLDVNAPSALTGTTPIRVTIGHPGSRFYMQAWGSGRTDNLKNSGSITASGERLIIGGDAGTSVMLYANNQFTTGPGHMFIQGTPGATMGFIGIGNNAPTTKLDVSGEVKMTVANITGGSDLAEKFEVRGVAGSEVTAGMVVCIDPESPGRLMVSTKAHDKTVAGIVSGAGGLNSGMVMGQQKSLADGAHAVALTGRVYCLADTSAEGIEPGDLLTTSPVAGHAMKVTDHDTASGAIIGKAMTPLAKGGNGMVLVLVSLQ